MEEFQNNDNSKTVFVRDSSLSGLKKYALIILIVAILIGGVVVWAGISSGARTALSHAKDIKVAMKMVSIEYFRKTGSIYNPNAENGMQDNAVEKLRSVCTVKGEIILTGWDPVNNVPTSFTYREGQYLVEFKDTVDGNGKYGSNGKWSVYCNIKIMEYDSGE